MKKALMSLSVPVTIDKEMGVARAYPTSYTLPV